MEGSITYADGLNRTIPMRDGLLEFSLKVEDPRDSRTAAHNIKAALEHLSDLKNHVLIRTMFVNSEESCWGKVVNVNAIAEIRDDEEFIGRGRKTSTVGLSPRPQ